MSEKNKAKLEALIELIYETIEAAKKIRLSDQAREQVRAFFEPRLITILIQTGEHERRKMRWNYDDIIGMFDYDRNESVQVNERRFMGEVSDVIEVSGKVVDVEFEVLQIQ